MNILITGAAGFIGSALCRRLAPGNEVIGIDIKGPTDRALNITWEQADLADLSSVGAICEKYSPDVIIHCAGIAQQKIGAIDSATYMRVNSEATANLAKAAAKYNPDISFIFLSSVSVYGEGPHPRGIRSAVTSEFHGAGINPQITQNKKDVSRPSTISRTYGVNKGAKAQKRKNDNGIGEESTVGPSSDYAVSKLDAERRLIALFDEEIIHNLVILRLAPVYAREWSLNLDRRVFAPRKVAYVRFGSGLQKMSALARPSLVDFIQYLLQRLLHNSVVKIFNVCDSEAYDFNTIIRVFKESGIHPRRPLISVPLSPVWFATRLAGFLLPNKRKWLHSCYDKLAGNLIFDNSKMLGTGFAPRYSLETIFPKERFQ